MESNQVNNCRSVVMGIHYKSNREVEYSEKKSPGVANSIIGADRVVDGVPVFVLHGQKKDPGFVAI